MMDLSATFPARRIVYLLCLLCVLGWANLAPAADGPIGVRPKLSDSENILTAVKFRWRARVNANSGNTILKILFVGGSFYNPDRTEPQGNYQFEANFYSYWVQYTDTSCLGWPPQGFYFPGQSGLWVSIPDYSAAPDQNFPVELKGRVGVRPSDTLTFPRQNSGIDNIPFLTEIETISQKDVTGQDISFELSRGDTFTNDLSNWGYRFNPTDPSNSPNACLPNLPSGFTYRKWRLTATFDGNPLNIEDEEDDERRARYEWDFALPEQQARYLDPNRLIDMVTEFLQTEGFFQVFLWDFAVQAEGRSVWQPINNFFVDYQANVERNTGSGGRVGCYRGRSVLEFSNDRTDTYAALNDVLIIGARQTEQGENEQGSGTNRCRSER